MLSNPKQVEAAKVRNRWFHYYAGYSPEFVNDVLQRLRAGKRPLILDPWNGAGTTTTTAAELGLESVGFDINPVMVIVAKSKLLSHGVKQSLLPIAQDLVSTARMGQHVSEQLDPLEEWFSPSSASCLRALTNAIRSLLIDHEGDSYLYAHRSLDRISDLAAFFLVALFRTTRSFLDRFQASNPTWMKAAPTPHHRVRPRPDDLWSVFESFVEQMASTLKPGPKDRENCRRAKATVDLASSEKLPLTDQRVDAVVSSPPYCTRIDYATATKPELAVLGCKLDGQFDDLRRSIIGSPTVVSTIPKPDMTWGSSCLRFCDAVASHQSKSSQSYYAKLFRQYFGSVKNSLTEIGRVLKAQGQCVLVVQDSYYKELHNDLALFFTEMATSLGWQLDSRYDYKTHRTMARLNPRVRKYRPATHVTESILWFTTQA